MLIVHQERGSATNRTEMTSGQPGFGEDSWEREEARVS